MLRLLLLVWLPGDGVRVEDALEYWKIALGEEAAVAVVAPPYPQVETELYITGEISHSLADRMKAGQDRVDAARKAREKKQ